jgi:hypothetical protein
VRKAASKKATESPALHGAWNGDMFKMKKGPPIVINIALRCTQIFFIVSPNRRNNDMKNK